MRKTCSILLIVLVLMASICIFNPAFIKATTATFGYDGIGETIQTLKWTLADQQLFGGVFVTDDTADFAVPTSIKWYGSAQYGADVKALIIDNSTLTPMSLSDAITVDSTPAWHTNTFTAPYPLAKNTAYILAVIASNKLSVYKTADASSQQFLDPTNNYIECPDPSYLTDGTYDNYKVSIYCTYTIMAPPTFSQISTNSTVANSTCKFSASCSSSWANSGFIFSTNNTADNTWQNDTWTSFSGSSWANTTKTLNETIGQTIGYQWFANDSKNRWDSTTIQTLTTTGYTVTPSTDSHSAITPSTMQTVCAGADLTFDFSADGGYSIESVIVNSTYQAPTTSPYTFTNIQSDQSIAVSTSAVIYSISATSDANSVISPSGAHLLYAEGTWAP